METSPSVDSSVKNKSFIDNCLLSQKRITVNCPLYSIEVENPVSTAQRIGQIPEYWEHIRNMFSSNQRTGTVMPFP